MNQSNYHDMQIGYAYACGHHQNFSSDGSSKIIFAKTENDTVNIHALTKFINRHKDFINGYNLYFTENFNKVCERRTIHINFLPNDLIRMIKKSDYSKMTLNHLVILLSSLINKKLYSTHGPLVVTLSHVDSESYFSFDIQNNLIHKKFDVTSDYCSTQVRISKNRILKFNTYSTMAKMFTEMDKSVAKISTPLMSDVYDLTFKFIFWQPKVLQVIPKDIIDFLFGLLSNQMIEDLQKHSLDGRTF